jgi:vacuolar protein sorting-associated protein 53
LEDFSKHAATTANIRHPSVTPTVTLPPAPSTTSSFAPASASALVASISSASSAPASAFASALATPLSAYSREDVLTRAAALGRGAATTGFKRFLALTEAAKDKKDGPFRKLFNS